MTHSDDRLTTAQARAAVDEAAAMLVGRYNDEPDSANHRAMLEWAAADPRHAVALTRARRAWAAAGQLQVLSEPAERANQAWMLDALVGRRRALAAMLGAAAVGTASIIGLQLTGRTIRYASDGAPERIALADGSVVTLDAFSSMEVTLGSDRRQVQLLRGGALFDVARDPARAFHVVVNMARAEAHDATFSARIEREVAELTVATGQIDVASASGRARLVGGEAAAVSGQAVARLAIDPAAVARRLSWLRGVLEFNDDPLMQAVDAFNRYRHKPLIIGDPAIVGLLIDGRFRTTDVGGFVAALSRTFDVRAVASRDGTIVLAGALPGDQGGRA